MDKHNSWSSMLELADVLESRSGCNFRVCARVLGGGEGGKEKG